MRKSESLSPTELQTQAVAAELRLRPTDEVFRYLHPVMICGIENGQLLLQGTRSNGTAVIDTYSPGNARTRASGLENPGLNFTRQFHENYKSMSRRLAISCRMADQPPGLQIYHDVGSEVSSVYFTLPENQYFHANYKNGDVLEIGVALEIRTLMRKLHIHEEPEYYSWLNSGDGVRVVFRTQNSNKDISTNEIHFLRNGNSLVIDASHGKIHPEVEYLAVLRLFLDNKGFDTIIGTQGTRYTADDLINRIPKNPKLKGSI